MEKLNPQKPGISQPQQKPQPPAPREPQRGGTTTDTPQKPDDKDKRRQVPIEGE